MPEVNVINIKNPFLDQKPGHFWFKKKYFEISRRALLRNIYRRQFLNHLKSARVNFSCWWGW
jgi:hypothetical protein